MTPTIQDVNKNNHVIEAEAEILTDAIEAPNVHVVNFVNQIVAFLKKKIIPPSVVEIVIAIEETFVQKVPVDDLAIRIQIAMA